MERRVLCVTGMAGGGAVLDLLRRRGVAEADGAAFAAVGSDLAAALGADPRARPAGPPGWADAPGLAPLRARAAALVAALPGGAVAWHDPDAALVLPFWQRVTPLVTVLSVPDPAPLLAGPDPAAIADRWLRTLAEALRADPHAVVVDPGAVSLPPALTGPLPAPPGPAAAPAAAAALAAHRLLAADRAGGGALLAGLATGWEGHAEAAHLAGEVARLSARVALERAAARDADRRAHRLDEDLERVRRELGIARDRVDRLRARPGVRAAIAIGRRVGPLRDAVVPGRRARRPDRPAPQTAGAGGVPGRWTAPPHVTIVMPVHDAPEELRRCLSALRRCTTGDADLLLLDDASTDPDVAPLLADAATWPRVRVLRNDRNLGFVRTANRGTALAPGDVVLLNSDTEVTPGWLAGLQQAAHAGDRVGSATAVSDNAGAFSVPVPGGPNPLPAWAHRDAAGRALRRAGPRVRPTAPTGNGFCMYLRRAALDEVGLLDAEHFPRGYGEENDLGMRMVDAGWANVVDDATLVFHARTASFGDAKRDLLRAGRAQVDALHPTYTARVRAFVGGEPLRRVQERAARALRDLDARPRVLLAAAGGAAVAVPGAHWEALVLRAGRDRLTLLGAAGEERGTWARDAAGLARVLADEGIDVVHAPEGPADVLAAARALGIPAVTGPAAGDVDLRCRAALLRERTFGTVAGRGPAPVRVAVLGAGPVARARVHAPWSHPSVTPEARAAVADPADPAAGADALVVAAAGLDAGAAAAVVAARAARDLHLVVDLTGLRGAADADLVRAADVLVVPAAGPHGSALARGADEPHGPGGARGAGRLVVVPDALDEGAWLRHPPAPPRPPDGTVRVLALGWTAGPADLELLRPALDELGPGWSLDVAGGAGDAGWYRRLAAPGDDVAGWPALRAGRWDLAVAPLAGDGALAGDQAFLEHAALGLPGVYSDTGPYAAGVRDGDTGLLAGDPDGWAKALRRLAEDPDLRAALAARARATVVAHRLLASQADTHLGLLRPEAHPAGRRPEPARASRPATEVHP